MKLEKVYPKDIIALVVLIGCGILLYKGVDSFVSACATLILGYYFSKRVFEEKNREES